MSKKTLAVWVGVGIVAGFLGWYGYDYYYLGYKEVNEYKNIEKRYIDAMTADTYGGKTPKETLDLFVAALKKGDIDLASKYFMLDDNLSRDRWVEWLSILKNERNLSRLADDIVNKAKPGNLSTQNHYGYVLFNKDGTVGLQIDMLYNKYSEVWKIENI